MTPARRSSTPRRLFRQALAQVARARQDSPPEAVTFALVVSLVLLILAIGLAFGPAVAPSSALLIPVLFGGLLLTRRRLCAVLVAVVVATAVLVWQWGLAEVRAGALVLLLVTGLIAYGLAGSRDQTGLAGVRGDSVLIELRRRLEQQGRLPGLPHGWHAEAVVRPAGGGPFSGDFVVSSCTGGGRQLEVALVDVSGKGVGAGTRALLLSGALGGLIGSRAPEGLLPGANAYLDRQDWDEGFATAVHLVLDLDTGEFAVSSAGHPPAAHFDASAGRWNLGEASGPALGLLPEVAYVPARGRLDPGDALLLYTDGLVEIPGRDLSVGIDKLLGEAERLVPRGFAGGADALVTAVAGGSPDDRGLVLLWRS